MKKTLLMLSTLFYVLQIPLSVSANIANIDKFFGTWDLYRQQGENKRHFVMNITDWYQGSGMVQGTIYEPSCHSSADFNNVYIDTYVWDIWEDYGDYRIVPCGSDFFCYTMSVNIFVSFQNDFFHVLGRDEIGYNWSGVKRGGGDSSTTTTAGGNLIVNHMMTKDPKPGTGCSVPTAETTFYYNDEAVYCWCHYKAEAGLERHYEWYKPDGELYYEDSDELPYDEGCFYPGISINGYQPAEIPGEWHIDVYLGGVKQCTDYFTIVNPNVSTTTTAKSSTTTTEKGCPFKKVYGDDSKELEILRYIRDNILSQTEEGQEIIKLYYQWSPVLIKAMEEDKGFKEEVREMIEGVLGVIEKEVE